MTLSDREMACKDFVELVTELLANALGAEDRARLEEHLRDCPPCTIYVGQIKATIEFAGALREPPTSSAAAAPDPALMDAFRRAIKK